MYKLELLRLKFKKLRIPKIILIPVIILIVFVLLLIVILLTPLKNQLLNISYFKDVILNRKIAEWIKYDASNPDPYFTLIATDTTAPLWKSCDGAKYKCGDEGWKKLDVKINEIKKININNRCLIETSGYDFCDIVLADGSVISMNKGTKIQIAFENNKFKIIQSIGETFQYVKPNTDYSVVIGNNIISSGNAIFSVGYAKNGDKDKIQVVVGTGVTNGNVTLSQKNSDKVTTVSPGQYAVFDYNSSPCPDIFKQCGNSCIPMEATCCNDNFSSFCDSYGICVPNSDNKCSVNNLFRSEKSAFCCQTVEATDTDIGSYTCLEGKIACGYACIPAKEKCNVLGGSGAHSSDVYAVGVNSFTVASELYNIDDYINSFARVFDILNKNNFNSLNSLQLSDLLISSFTEGEHNYIEEYNQSVENYSSTGGDSTHNRCDDIPWTNVVFEWCTSKYKPPAGVDSDFVYCGFTSDQVPNSGDGFYPPECVPEGTPTY